MTWLELKQYITDLGFEEDTTTDVEYSRIVVNATNRAIDIIRYHTIPRLEGYLRTIGYGEEVEDEDGYKHWEFPIIEYVNIETEKLHEFNMPRMFNPLLQLCTAYYVWLDDDESKAVQYWNQFTALEQGLFDVYASLPRRSRIIGGF